MTQRDMQLGTAIAVAYTLRHRWHIEADAWMHTPTQMAYVSLAGGEYRPDVAAAFVEMLARYDQRKDEETMWADS